MPPPKGMVNDSPLFTGKNYHTLKSQVKTDPVRFERQREIKALFAQTKTLAFFGGYQFWPRKRKSSPAGSQLQLGWLLWSGLERTNRQRV